MLMPRNCEVFDVLQDGFEILLNCKTTFLRFDCIGMIRQQSTLEFGALPTFATAPRRLMSKAPTTALQSSVAGGSGLSRHRALSTSYA